LYLGLFLIVVVVFVVVFIVVVVIFFVVVVVGIVATMLLIVVLIDFVEVVVAVSRAFGGDHFLILFIRSVNKIWVPLSQLLELRHLYSLRRLDVSPPFGVRELRTGALTGNIVELLAKCHQAFVLAILLSSFGGAVRFAAPAYHAEPLDSVIFGSLFEVFLSGALIGLIIAFSEFLEILAESLAIRKASFLISLFILLTLLSNSHALEPRFDAILGL